MAWLPISRMTAREWVAAASPLCRRRSGATRRKAPERRSGVWMAVRADSAPGRPAPPPSWYDAELLHDRKAVHQVPRLCNQAILVEAVKIPETCHEFLAGSRHAHHSRDMSRGRNAATHDPIVLGKRILDDDLDVRPCGERTFEECTDVLSAGRGRSRHDLMAERVMSEAAIEISRIVCRLRREIVRLVTKWASVTRMVFSAGASRSAGFDYQAANRDKHRPSL